MSVLGRVRKLLSRLVPDQVAWALREEFVGKQGRYQKKLLKSHGSNFYLADHVVIHGPGCFTCGNDCAINEFVHIRAFGGVTIGNGVWIANHAALVSETHPTDVEYVGDYPPVLHPIVIEDNVWIGAHATILPGVTLGRSSIIGAGSVVTKDVPPYAIVAGVPAKILRYKTLRPETADAHSKN